MLQKAICANGGSGPMAGGKFYGNCLLESPSLHLAPSGAMLCKKDIWQLLTKISKKIKTWNRTKVKRCDILLKKWRIFPCDSVLESYVFFTRKWPTLVGSKVLKQPTKIDNSWRQPDSEYCGNQSFQGRFKSTRSAAPQQQSSSNVAPIRSF